MQRYLCHVDRREFDKAANLFMPSACWQSHGVTLRGKEALLEALHASLNSGIIRHVISNTIVDVVDATHAVLRDYHTIYYKTDSDFVDELGSNSLVAPHRLTESRVEFVHTTVGWRIESNKSEIIFRRDCSTLVPLEVWAKKAGKLA